jgi:hypothetical protein
MTRASLTTLIYNKALNIGSHAAETGKVITIISTDVDGAVEAGRMVHEAWAKLFELVLGVVLLVRQVKWLAPLPFIIIVCKLACGMTCLEGNGLLMAAVDM